MDSSPPAPADSPREDGESQRPSIKVAATSPTAFTNLIAALALLACFFLPHSVGCNDRTLSPLAVSVGIIGESNKPTEILMLAVLWPFALAAATLIVFAVLVVLRPPWYWRALFALPLGSAGILSVIWLMFLFVGTDASRVAMATAAIVWPTATCVGARMWWLYRRGDVMAAATWGHGMFCVLAAFSLRWFWFPPITRIVWGGYLAIASALCMMLASWTWTTRARYDLYDRSTAPAAFQISLRQIVIGIALTAVALTYWRVLGKR